MDNVQIISAYLHNRQNCQTATVYQYNQGMILRIVGPTLSTAYEVDFANSVTGQSITQIGGAEGVTIPDQFFTPGSMIHAWVVLVGEDYVVTRYHIMIPISPRAVRTSEEPTPSQQGAIDQAIAALNQAVDAVPAVLKITGRVSSLDSTPLATGETINAVGIPVYVEDVTQYAAYGLTEAGWYVFARITAPEGITVSDGTSVEGAAGSIITPGADHVDVSVKFQVAAESQAVSITWAQGSADRFVFAAPDLATRNLDYRTTFYIYDIAPYAQWEFALTTDATFQAGKNYYTEQDGVYTLAEVQTVAYQLTADETFQSGKTYYTKGQDDTYTAAEVTVGEAVTADTYYEQTTAPVPAYYVDQYTLTADETFQNGKTYYTESDGEYTAAEVTPGEEVPADTYYEHAYAQAEGAFQENVPYYTKSGNEYSAAAVTAGDAIPAYYNHSKLHIEGMVANVTYRLDEMVDCPVEITLPEIPEDGHGAWFEIQMRYNGSYSCTLLPPEGVKVGTAQTQAQSGGINTIDLQYTIAGDVKMWTLLNTHSNIPA